jgi:HEAT repeat protein
VRLGAIRALGTWQSADAAPELLSLAKTLQDAKIKTLCLRGYLTLAGRSDLTMDQRLSMCKQIAPYLEQSAERKQWLGVLGRLDSPKALAQILPHFEDPDVSDTACAVSIAMIERLAKKNREITKNPTVEQTLQKVVDVSTNADYRKRAQSLLSGA